jgi:hypothetical protein
VCVCVCVCVCVRVCVCISMSTKTFFLNLSERVVTRQHRPRKLTPDAMEELYLVCSYVRLLAKQSLLVKGTPTVDIDGCVRAWGVWAGGDA